MTLKNYILAMSFLSLVCWVAFFFVAGMVNPFTTSWLGLLLFYTTLAASLIGTSSILGLVFRFFFKKDQAIFNSVKNSFRQSFLFSIFIVSVLILKSFNLFSWVNLFVLVAIFAILEIFLRPRKIK